MSVLRLAVVPVEDKPNSPAERAGRLYAEAQAAALEQIRVLEDGLARVIALSAEVAEGGEVYPVGVRDLCRRMGDDLNQRSQTLDAIANRALNRPV